MLALNSTEGDADEAVRLAYDEPAWNYPVLHVVDAEGIDRIERVADRWNLAGMTHALTAGLLAASRPVPAWLALFDQEASAREAGVSTAVFGMT